MIDDITASHKAMDEAEWAAPNFKCVPASCATAPRTDINRRLTLLFSFFISLPLSLSVSAGIGC